MNCERRILRCNARFAQVMALADGELRIRVAELAGWTWSSQHMSPLEQLAEPGMDGSLYGLHPLTRYWKMVPDYPRDIAAAWELFSLMPMPCGIERGYEERLEVGPVGFYVGFGWLHPEHDEDDVWGETVWSESAPRAITRAFVLAMSGGADAPK